MQCYAGNISARNADAIAVIAQFADISVLIGRQRAQAHEPYRALAFHNIVPELGGQFGSVDKKISRKNYPIDVLREIIRRGDLERLCLGVCYRYTFECDKVFTATELGKSA